jgi:hypothetical protein
MSLRWQLAEWTRPERRGVGLLKPAGAVSKRVNSFRATNEDATLIEPLAASPAL